jgi:hypothetical protein
MTEYTPDAWVTIKIDFKDPTRNFRCVVGGWYGGYGDNNTWRRSSPIQQVHDLVSHYEFETESGAVYICAKSANRVSMPIAQVIANLRNHPDVELVTVDEVYDY